MLNLYGLFYDTFYMFYLSAECKTYCYFYISKLSSTFNVECSNLETFMFW